MDQRAKDSHLQKANAHIAKTRDALDIAIRDIQTLIDTRSGAAKTEDKWTNEYVKALNRERLRQFNLLKGSPYFNKCECTIDGTRKDYYFSKFSFPEESIYSWVTPVASLRFDNPGPTSYQIPSGTRRTGVMHEKDDYQIIDGKILFFTKEIESGKRELIHQEYFSNKKSGFLLPEIVSKMEKAQDTIIRAHHKNPFVISGPAGSGKTTLALHRIAYLMQAPASTEIYKNSSIIVFVQDKRSKDYFSHLLPDLGITTVEVVTFVEWALRIVNIENKKEESGDDTDDGPSDTTSAISSYSSDLSYEQDKIKALRATSKLPNFPKSPFNALEKIYKLFLSPENLAVFKKQKEQNVLDRIDLTLLLMMYQKSHKELATVKRFHATDKDSNIVEKRRREILDYRLMVIDEFQNYLPEQLKLLNICIDEEYRSVIYVGDLGQQINPGAIQQWSDINETILTDRHIVLDKVYRNTRKILSFVKTLGYNVEIPESIKEGVDVVSKDFISEKESENRSKNKVAEYLRSAVSARKDRESIGIIGMDTEVLAPLRYAIETDEFLHLITARESQGLEFDKVYLVGFNEKTYFEKYKSSPPDLQNENQKIDRDLLYIAITRAISELEIIII